MPTLTIEVDDKMAAHVEQLQRLAGNLTLPELFCKSLALYDVCLKASEEQQLVINGQRIKLK